MGYRATVVSVTTTKKSISSLQTDEKLKRSAKTANFEKHKKKIKEMSALSAWSVDSGSDGSSIAENSPYYR